MLSKEKAYEEMISAKKRGDENFIFKMLYDVMYHQIMVCDEGIPLLEAIIAVFSNKALEQVKGKVKLLTNDLPQNKVLDMNSKADIVASYDNGRYIIEMNSSSIMIVRNNFYDFKVASSGLKMGNSSYEKEYNTCLINFNSNGGKQKRLNEMITLRYADGKIYDETIKIFSVDIEKALNPRYNYVNRQEKIIGCMCRIMATSDARVMLKEALKIMSKEEANRLVKRAKELSNSSEMIKFFDNERFYELVRNTEFKEAQEKAQKKALEKGHKKGLKENAITNAKNAINLGLDNDTISKITGLSLETIKSLR